MMCLQLYIFPELSFFPDLIGFGNKMFHFYLFLDDF